MKMSQIALNMADNASRIGTLNSNLAAKVINEQQINDVFQAASIQAGAAGLYDDGRTVLSSLEVNASGGQTIMWQRCKGMELEDSNYVALGTGATQAVVYQFSGILYSEYGQRAFLAMTVVSALGLCALLLLARTWNGGLLVGHSQVPLPR